MLREILMSAMLVGATLAPSDAVAQSAAGGITYDCDTAANHFSDLSLPAGAVPVTVSGRVRLLTAETSTSYVPVTRVMISNASDQPGPPDESWAGFEFMVVPAKVGAKPSIKVLAFTAREKGQENKPDVVGPPGGEEVGFTLAYDGKHVTVNVDGHTKQLPFAADRPVLRIVCSTGEFLYTGLEVVNR